MPNSRGELDRMVFVGSKNRVAALHPETGAVLWQVTVPTAFWSVSSYMTMARDGEWLYVAVGSRVHKLDALTGTVMWSQDVSGLGALPVMLAGPSGSGAGQQHLAAVAAASAASAATMG